MRKPSFSVVSTAIAILVGLGFVSKALVGFIPAPDESELAREPSIFLRRAAIQQIEWKKPTDEAFASARRRDLPILLFMGNGFDPLARGLDRGVLLSPRVQAFLSRNFECVRVDLVAHPEFRNAFLPLTKAKLGVSPGFQMIVVDSSGKIIDHIATLVGLFPNDEALFIRELVEARNRFEQPILARGEVSFEEAQREDLKALEGLEVPSPPAFANFTRDLVADIDPAGGFNDPDHRTLRAEPWRFLLAIGRISDFEDSIMPVLHSPVADLLDGGFFSGSRDVKWIEVEHGKSAVVNSEMASLLSAAALVSNDPEYRYLAERTFDGFLNEFVQPTGIAALRPSDQLQNQRSPRSSFGVRKLREILTEPADYRFAQDALGLRVETNPRMTPRLADPRTLADKDSLNRVLNKLAEASSAAMVAEGVGYADVTGNCVARLIECARLLGDPARLDQATNLFNWVRNAQGDGSILHSSPASEEPAFVGDHLAFADAALQHYLATGTYDSIQSGKTVLKQALERFEGLQPGILNIGLERKAPQLWTISKPEIYDGYSESTSAQAIRLALDYGRIFPADTGFLRFASRGAGLFGPVATSLGPAGASYMLSAIRVFDDEFYVSVGPRAQEWADEIAREQPFRLSLAAFGEIRMDLQARGPGIYVVRGATVRGPMTAAEAAEAAPRFLGPGL